MVDPSTLRRPLLPGPLAAPLSLLPASLHSRLLAGALNRILAVQLRQGEMDFLNGRSVAIKVRDAGIAFALTLAGKRFAVNRSLQEADLGIEATVFDFLVLAGRQEDPDTLVFQRRLVMQGDTELGLAVKNFLDGLDADVVPLYGAFETALRRLVPLYQRLFS
jgi:predicted lipid carrier protein YhbT